MIAILQVLQLISTIIIYLLPLIPTYLPLISFSAFLLSLSPTSLELFFIFVFITFVAPEAFPGALTSSPIASNPTNSSNVNSTLSSDASLPPLIPPRYFPPSNSTANTQQLQIATAGPSSTSFLTSPTPTTNTDAPTNPSPPQTSPTSKYTSPSTFDPIVSSPAPISTETLEPQVPTADTSTAPEPQQAPATEENAAASLSTSPQVNTQDPTANEANANSQTASLPPPPPAPQITQSQNQTQLAATMETNSTVESSNPKDQKVESLNVEEFKSDENIARRSRDKGKGRAVELEINTTSESIPVPPTKTATTQTLTEPEFESNSVEYSSSTRILKNQERDDIKESQSGVRIAGPSRRAGNWRETIAELSGSSGVTPKLSTTEIQTSTQMMVQTKSVEIFTSPQFTQIQKQDCEEESERGNVAGTSRITGNARGVERETKVDLSSLADAFGGLKIGNDAESQREQRVVVRQVGLNNGSVAMEEVQFVTKRKFDSDDEEGLQKRFRKDVRRDKGKYKAFSTRPNVKHWFSKPSTSPLNVCLTLPKVDDMVRASVESGDAENVIDMEVVGGNEETTASSRAELIQIPSPTDSNASSGQESSIGNQSPVAETVEIPRVSVPSVATSSASFHGKRRRQMEDDADEKDDGKRARGPMEEPKVQVIPSRKPIIKKRPPRTHRHSQPTKSQPFPKTNFDVSFHRFIEMNQEEYELSIFNFTPSDSPTSPNTMYSSVDTVDRSYSSPVSSSSTSTYINDDKAQTNSRPTSPTSINIREDLEIVLRRSNLFEDLHSGSDTTNESDTESDNDEDEIEVVTSSTSHSAIAQEDVLDGDDNGDESGSDSEDEVDVITSRC